MICVVCKHGETRQGTATITLERGGTTLVIKGVPARVCDNCGESYIEQAQVTRLLAVAEEVAQSGVEVDIRRFAA